MTKFSIKSVNRPTPYWATVVFRVVFILTGVATFVIAADPSINTDLSFRIGIYLKGLDMVVWGITRMIGVDVSRDFNYENGEIKNGQ